MVTSSEGHFNSTVPLIFFYNWSIKEEKKILEKSWVFFSFFSSQSTKKVIKECVAWFNCDFFSSSTSQPKKVFFPVLYLGSNWSMNLLHIVIKILEMSQKYKPKYGDIVWMTIIITQLFLWSFSTVLATFGIKKS